LKQLANDILKAQKENNPSRAQELLNMFVLPNFRQWYADNFIDVAASRVVPAYAASGQALPVQLAGIFLGAFKEGFKNVEVFAMSMIGTLVPRQVPKSLVGSRQEKPVSRSMNCVLLTEISTKAFLPSYTSMGLSELY